MRKIIGYQCLETDGVLRLLSFDDFVDSNKFITCFHSVSSLRFSSSYSYANGFRLLGMCWWTYILAFFFCLSHFPPSLLSLLYLCVLAYAMIMLYIVCLMEPYLNNSFTRVSSVIYKIVDSVT